MGAGCSAQKSDYISYTPCKTSDISQLEEACQCAAGTFNECAAGKFCWDNFSCEDFMRIPQYNNERGMVNVLQQSHPLDLHSKS